jgi:hypothetical protein
VTVSQCRLFKHSTYRDSRNRSAYPQMFLPTRMSMTRSYVSKRSSSRQSVPLRIAVAEMPL